MIKRFAQYYKPYKWQFFLDMLASFILAVCDLFYPIITRNMLNTYIPNRQMRTVVLAGGILLAVYFVKALLTYFVQYFGHMVGISMQADMRQEVFDHLQKLPFSYYDEHKTGAIMSTIVNDLFELSELAHHGPEELFVSGVMMLGAFVYLCTINPYLTLIIFAFIPFLIYFTIKMRARMGVAFAESRAKVGDINATLENSVSGVRVAKAFVNAEYEAEKFSADNKAFQKARQKAYHAMGQFYGGNGFILDLLNVVVVVAGGVFTFRGIITYGDLVAYMLFINLFLTPVKKLIQFVEQFQNGMTGFQRFVALTAVEPEAESPDAVELDHVAGDIAFHHVSFSYGDGKEVLHDINFSIGKGKTVALVGPSGGGKTTICHLIPRFYNCLTGNITIDGQDITRFTLGSLRKQIGIVQQDVFLFNGSIRDNIAYGNFDASEEEIVRAAKAANIHDYIMTLPAGYETQVGERGVKLSGGQKQRISIARVFLKNPPILILDEATSALDNQSEVLIQEALDALSVDRTTLVVAHRLSTIKNADEILVITNDGIAEQGTHERLMAQNGIYAAFYTAQFREG